MPYVTQCLADAPGVLVAASDYLKTLPNLVSKWMPRRLASLGTDGFGRSEGRASLREFFEVDARFIAMATLYELHARGKDSAIGGPKGHHGAWNQRRKAESAYSVRPVNASGRRAFFVNFPPAAGPFLINFTTFFA